MGGFCSNGPVAYFPWLVTSHWRWISETLAVQPKRWIARNRSLMKAHFLRPNTAFPLFALVTKNERALCFSDSGFSEMRHLFFVISAVHEQTIRVITEWDVRACRMRGYVTNVWLWILKGRDHCEDLGVDVTIISKCIRKYWVWADFKVLNLKQTVLRYTVSCLYDLGTKHKHGTPVQDCNFVYFKDLCTRGT